MAVQATQAADSGQILASPNLSSLELHGKPCYQLAVLTDATELSALYSLLVIEPSRLFISASNLLSFLSSLLSTV